MRDPRNSSRFQVPGSKLEVSPRPHNSEPGTWNLELRKLRHPPRDDVLLPLLLAKDEEFTKPAMFDRVWVRVRAVRHRIDKAVPQPPVVRHVVSRSKRLALADWRTNPSGELRRMSSDSAPAHARRSSRYSSTYCGIASRNRRRARFGFSSEDHITAIGRGVMDEIWHGPFWTLPFLSVGSWRSIMFPERGRNVPFSIENHAYRDSFGRETVSWIRRFAGRKPRRFDAYMIFSDARNRIVDYLGTHQHLAVDLDLSVDERGGLRIRSGAQRLYEGRIAFEFPLIFSGVANSATSPYNALWAGASPRTARPLADPARRGPARSRRPAPHESRG